MSAVAAFVRWDSGCWNYPNQSLTGSEYTWGGYADYGQEYPCPNGLGLATVDLCDSPAWRRRIEKAKRDIEQHKSELRVKELAASLQPNVVAAFLRALKYD